MPNNNKPLTHVNLAIWGMHRSGTSLLCSLLAECGVYFGEPDQLIPPNQENPNGFWENIKVRELNDTLLMATGCDWDHITRFDPANIPDEQLRHFAEESKNILRALGERPISGIKEPRMCVLTSVWAPILADSVDVFVYRHPAEIAKSLAMRNDIPYDIGLCICEYYLVHLLNYLTSRNVIAVSHQDLLQSPGEALEKLSAHIQALKGNSPLVAPETRIASLVDMNYYRARRDQEQLPEPLERIWNNLQPEISLPQKLNVSARSISLLGEYEHQESEKAFLVARLLRNKNRQQENLLDQISQDYETAKAEIDLLHGNMKELNNINRLYEDTFTTSDDIANILAALNIHLGIFTGRFFRVCLSVTSAFAGLLRISSLKSIDQKLMNLITDIDLLIERYEAQRALVKKNRENYKDTGNNG